MANSASIRVPTPTEMERVAFVAAAGFHHSPATAYQRPKSNLYPETMVASFRNQLNECLWAPNRALLIVEDDYDKNENTKIDRPLREKYGGWPSTQTAGKIIVGFVALTFKPGSPRVGQYQPQGDRPPADDSSNSGNPNMDQSIEGVITMAHFLDAPLAKHLGGLFNVDMLCVHPMYWRRGHGSSLLSLAAKLADEDRIQLGVASVPMGVKISQKAGFKEREVVEVESCGHYPEGFNVWIGIRQPRSFNAYVEDAPDSGR